MDLTQHSKPGSNGTLKKTQSSCENRSYLSVRKQTTIHPPDVYHAYLITENASRNNVPNKTLLVGTFVCAVLGTLRSRFCVPNTVLDVPDIIWNILPNNIRHIFLISDKGS